MGTDKLIRTHLRTGSINMVSGFPENSEVFAITHVHAPCTDSDFDINNFLPLIKGELLTVKKAQSNTQTWVRNAYGIEGLVRNNHVSPADLYCHEDFFLADFTSQMAEKILADKPNGSFIIRTNSKDVAKVIISAKFDTVTHYSFNKHGGGIEYDGVLYQSIPSFINKCSYSGVFKAGSLAIAVEDFGSLNKLCLEVHKGRQYTILRASRNTQWLIVRDEYDNEGSQTRFWTSNSECVRILFPLSRKETSVPDEIRTMDMKSVDLYFRALKEGKEHVRDIRLMVIGHHGAGKTTLTERLMGKQFRRVGSTNGIEIHLRQCQYNVATGIWLNPRPGSTRSNTNHSLHSSMSSIPTGEISSSRDVSGRESPLVKDTSETDSSPVKPEASLNGSHPSRESLKLRFDLNANNETVFGTGDNGDSGVSDENGIRYPSIDGDYQITNEDVPRMRSIHTFCGEVPGHPPVILVGTKSSEMNLEQGQTVESAAGKYFEKFRMMLENSPVAEHLQVALSKLGGEKRIISLDEVNSLDGEMDVRIKDSEEIVLFLRFHHAVGSLIYFDDEELAGYVVLDPQWIIDAFKSLITAQQFCKLRPQLRTLWKNLQEKACLHDKLIDEIWREDREGHFMEHRDILLSYMEKLDIIARPKVKLEDGQKQEIDFYFVPSLLRMKGQKDVSDLDKGKISERTPNLCFAFQEGFIPPMVFQRMLGACLSRYTIFRKVDEDQIFCDLGVFYLDSQHCFIFWLEDDVMKVRVVNLVENKVKSSLCDKLRRFLTNQLDRELCRYQNNTSFSVCIECLMPKKGSGSLINCKELLRDEKLPCCAHSQPHIVQSKIILQSWYPDYIEVPVGEVTLNWIDALPSVIRKREVTLKDLSKIAQSLGFNWEFVIIELGLPQVDIDQCKIDNKDQVAMQIYHCLLKWKSRDGYQANIETLVKAIQANQAVEADWEAIKNVVDRI
ncbi:CRADD-like protein [Mya arenaria]|uniref:CRADD-like protein n=1 Tax=Mya arenaria TaxID=6604 RepID=A0ABY7ENN7_MYAAR|nr:CRADD-like protein [Mya arenaria]